MYQLDLYRLLKNMSNRIDKQSRIIAERLKTDEKLHKDFRWLIEYSERHDDGYVKKDECDLYFKSILINILGSDESESNYENAVQQIKYWLLQYHFIKTINLIDDNKFVRPRDFKNVTDYLHDITNEYSYDLIARLHNEDKDVYHELHKMAEKVYSHELGVIDCIDCIDRSIKVDDSSGELMLKDLIWDYLTRADDEEIKVIINKYSKEKQL